MKIYQKYIDPEPGGPHGEFEITEERFLELTEESGYWKPGTALESLKIASRSKGKISFRTPWAEFRMEK